MKIFSLLGLLLSYPAFCAGPVTPTNDACKKFIPCGIYQSTETKSDGRVLTHEMAFAAEGSAKIKFTIAVLEGSERRITAEQNLIFSSDGSFTVIAGKEIRATGLCALSACTLSIRPSQLKGETMEQVVVLRFSGASLQMAKLVVGTDGKIFPSSVTLTKTE